MEFSAGRVEGALLVFGRAVGDERSMFVIEGFEHELVHRALSEPRGLMQVLDKFAAQEPQVVTMLTSSFGR